MKNRKSTVVRRNQILQKLSANGEVFVDALSKEFEVSEVTIRNDLDQLEKKRLLIRARGGAMQHQGGVGLDFGLSEKDKINLKEKMAIGQKAASLVKNDDIILIDGGTTTAEFAKNITHLSNLVVISNALNIANMLCNNPGINLIIPGGNMRHNAQSLVGPIAEKSLSKFHVDKLFLGVDGIHLEKGLYTPNVEEAHLNEQMINIANELIVLADSSKFNRQSFAHICGLERVDVIVTDNKIDAEFKNQLIDKGIKVIVA